MLNKYDTVASEYRPLIPAAYCEFPKVVRNKTTGELVTSACGKCASCLNRKGDRLSQRIEIESKKHSYVIFFTLTYCNDNIPFISTFEAASLVASENKNEVINLDVSFPTLRTIHKDKSVTFDSERIGVVSVRDIQCFLKRLRSNIDYKFPQLDYEAKRIRYFISSEYGPYSFRPHYHGILFVDNKEVAYSLLSKRLREDGESDNLIYQSWKKCAFARIKPSIVKKNAGRYVARYLSTSIRLPEILQFKPFRPFYVCSRHPFIGSYNINETQILSYFVNGVVKTPKFFEKALDFTNVLLPKSVLSTFFPKCSGYFSTDYRGKLSLYEKYFGKWSHVDKSDSHNYISKSGNLCDSSPLGMHHTTDAFNYSDYRFAKMCNYWCSKVWIIPNLDEFGFPDGTYSYCKLTPQIYIKLLEDFYKSYEYQLFVTDLQKLEILSASYTCLDAHCYELCEKYDIDPETFSFLVFHADQFRFLPLYYNDYYIDDDGNYIVSKGFEQLGNEHPWLDSITLRYFADRVFYDDDLPLTRPGSRLSLRRDLIDAIINKNPYRQISLASSRQKTYEYNCRKYHTSRFNTCF